MYTLYGGVKHGLPKTGRTFKITETAERKFLRLAFKTLNKNSNMD
jgi:hypothetical protein